MPVIQGIVNPTGAVVRKKGQFQVISKSATILEIEITGQNVTRAFVLATPWRNDGDIGPAGVTASPKPGTTDRMLFAVDGYYGLSFRVET